MAADGPNGCETLAESHRRSQRRIGGLREDKGGSGVATILFYRFS